MTSACNSIFHNLNHFSCRNNKSLRGKMLEVSSNKPCVASLSCGKRDFVKDSVAFIWKFLFAMLRSFSASVVSNCLYKCLDFIFWKTKFFVAKNSVIFLDYLSVNNRKNCSSENVVYDFYGRRFWVFSQKCGNKNVRVDNCINSLQLVSLISCADFRDNIFNFLIGKRFPAVLYTVSERVKRGLSICKACFSRKRKAEFSAGFFDELYKSILNCYSLFAAVLGKLFCKSVVNADIYRRHILPPFFNVMITIHNIQVLFSKVNFLSKGVCS